MNILFLPHGCCWANTASLFSIGKKFVGEQKSLSTLGPGTSTQVETVSGSGGLMWIRQGEPFLCSQAAANPAALSCSPTTSHNRQWPWCGGLSWWGREGAARGSLQCSPSAVGSQVCPRPPTSTPQPHHYLLLSRAWEELLAADGLDPDPIGNLSSNTAAPAAGGLAGSPACKEEVRCPWTFQLVPGPRQLWGCYWGNLWHRGRTATL